MLGIFSNWEKRKKLLEDISKELGSVGDDLRSKVSQAMRFKSDLKVAGVELDAEQSNKLAEFILKMSSFASALGELRSSISRLRPLAENIKRSYDTAQKLEKKAKDLNNQLNNLPRPKPEEVTAFRQEVDRLKSQIELTSGNMKIEADNYKFNKDEFENEDKQAHKSIKTVRIEINNFINDAKALKRDNVFLKIADICSKKDLDHLSSLLRKYSWS